MPQNDPKYWQSLEARAGDATAQDLAAREFVQELPVGVAAASAAAHGHSHPSSETSPGASGGLVQLGRPGQESTGDKGDYTRRDFFAVMGLSAAAASLAACTRAPVNKVIPFVTKPEEMTPGTASWYASSCLGCDAQCGILYKARDGRPIKAEGNPEHPVSKGGLCAVGQAAVLTTYDSSRARGPLAQGKATTWAALDAAVLAQLAKAVSAQMPVRVVAPLRTGPTFDAALAKFAAAVPGTKVVRWEPTGDRTSIAQAYKATHGLYAVPDYRFDRAAVVASFAADFLGTWLAPVAFARQYANARALPLAVRPEEGGHHGAVAGEAHAVESKAHGAAAAGHAEEGKRPLEHGQKKEAEPGQAAQPAEAAISRHWQLEPALSLTGSNADERVQLPPSALAGALAGVARRIAAKASHPEAAAIAKAIPALPEAAGLGGKLDRLAADLLAAGSRGLVVCGLPDAQLQVLCALANELLGATGTTADLAMGTQLDESALSLEDLLAEAEAGKGGVALVAGVNPVFAHPQGERVAAAFAKLALRIGLSDRPDETAKLCDFLAPDHAPAESWGDVEARRDVLTIRQPALSPIFETRSAVESLLLWAKLPAAEASHYAFLRERFRAEVAPKLKAPAASVEAGWRKALHDGFVELSSAPLVAKLNTAGAGAAVAGLSAAPGGDAEVWLYQKVGLRDGRQGNNAWLHELPDPVSKVVWDNYACLSPKRAADLKVADGALVTVTAGGKSVTLPALIQPGTHEKVVAIAIGYGRTAAGTVGDGVGVRAIQLAEAGGGKLKPFRAATIAPAGGSRELGKSQVHASLEGRPHIRVATLADYKKDPAASNPEEEKLETLWSPHEYKGHRWGMAIDLNSCTGCAACIVGCQAENNIAVVGRDEVGRGREMFWLRIDRYYEGDPEEPKEVLHQPMMCQHCTNAPCETVCPVIATVHSDEGLNQQVYNRCVGTRYCANNCPPKVRRFNWFEYRHDDPVERLVLNPDVVVRNRGVMEKCSLCIQRIQEGKAEAKREGRPLRDGEVQTACQQSCPSQAITFGDLNDPKSRLSALAHDARSYHLLHELNIGPVVNYLTKIKNPGAAS
jgi:molybdopterin-containing oxidoreductase family iron-sulfur binding subunit